MIKLAFFDMDGTLTVPEYRPEGVPVVGFHTVEDWLEYCRAEGEDGYRYCRPVKPVVRYAEKLKAEGALVYVLTAVKSQPEVAAKTKYIREHFGDLFEDMLTTPGADEKLEVIRQVAAEHGVELGACELIEDTLTTLLHVMGAGIKATHMSDIVADL